MSDDPIQPFCGCPPPVHRPGQCPPLPPLVHSMTCPVPCCGPTGDDEYDRLAAEVEPWLQQCGPCDFGLSTGCSHPDGDYRVILAKVWDAYEAAKGIRP